jgi:hypothetical protein
MGAADGESLEEFVFHGAAAMKGGYQILIDLNLK